MSPDYQRPSGGWRMARNGVPVPPVPTPCTTKWHEAIHEVRHGLSLEERRNRLWRTLADNEAWWHDHITARWEAAMDSEEGIVYPATRWNTAGRDRWWGVPGRTLDAVLAHIRAGGDRLEMPPTPPPSPPRHPLNPWLPRRSGTSGSASQSSSSLGPARSSPLSSHTRTSPYPVWVKQEEQ